MCNPAKRWRLLHLAKEASVSIGQASNVKQKLLDEEYITGEGYREISLKDPDVLLNKWAANYSYRQNKILNFYSLESSQEVETRISEYCSANNIPYAFTLTTGADIVSPCLRYNRVFLYLKEESIDKCPVN